MKEVSDCAKSRFWRGGRNGNRFQRGLWACSNTTDKFRSACFDCAESFANHQSQSDNRITIRHQAFVADFFLCTQEKPALCTRMPTLLEPATIDFKTRELCQFIVDEACFGEARAKIESFLTNDQAQSVYRAWQEKGQELHSMSQQGLQPSEEDLASLESLKQAVTNNNIAAEFAGAERQMNDVFGSVTKLLQKTLQLGRVPSEEEMAAESGGCCGGSGGGGCGC